MSRRGLPRHRRLLPARQRQFPTIPLHDPQSPGHRPIHARIGNPEEIWVTGVFRTGDGGFNAPWHWHHDPDSVELAEVTIEACQGCPSLVDADIDYWTNFGRYCAPGRIVARER